MTDRGDDERENATCPPGDSVMTDRDDISGGAEHQGTRSRRSHTLVPVKKVVSMESISRDRYVIHILRVCVSSSMCVDSVRHSLTTTRDIPDYIRSNAVDDIIRYIKTLLTRQCFPRVHRRESDVACDSVCFWVTQHCRDVDGVYYTRFCVRL